MLVDRLVGWLKSKLVRVWPPPVATQPAPIVVIFWSLRPVWAVNSARPARRDPRGNTESGASKHHNSTARES